METDFGKYAYDVKTTTIRELLKRDFVLGSFKSRWLSNQDSRYIESILAGLPLTPFIITELEEPGKDNNLAGRYRLVDGRCRYLALQSFYQNKLRLNDLDLMPTLTNKTYSEFFPFKQERFLNTIVTLWVQEPTYRNFEEKIRKRYS